MNRALPAVWNIERVEAVLNEESMLSKLRNLLPAGQEPIGFTLMVAAQCRKTPRLIECIQADSGLSFMSAVHQAAEIGLSLNPQLHRASLIPRKGKVCFEPEYRGLVQLALESGEVRAIWARCVYSEDDFDIVEGTNPEIIHRPSLDGARLDKDILFVYTVARLANGETQFDVMRRAEIDKARAMSDGSSSEYSPWIKWFPEMCKKVSIKRATKLLGLGSERFHKAVSIDDEGYQSNGKPIRTIALSAPGTPAKIEGPSPDDHPAHVHAIQEAIKGNRDWIAPEEDAFRDPQAEAAFKNEPRARNKKTDGPIKPPEEKPEPQSDEEIKKKLQTLLWDLCGKDANSYRKMLREFSGFIGGDGQPIPGWESLKNSNATGPWLRTTYGRVKKAWEKEGFGGPPAMQDGRTAEAILASIEGLVKEIQVRGEPEYDIDRPLLEQKTPEELTKIEEDIKDVLRSLSEKR